MDNFFMLPNEIFTYDLTPIEFCVVCYLAKCRNITTMNGNFSDTCSVTLEPSEDDEPLEHGEYELAEYYR